MRRLVAAVAVTLVIMYVVTFLVYGSIGAITGLEPPGDGPAMRFLFGVLVTKFGLALGFVLLFALAGEAWHGRWLQYASIWWVLFAVSELGQAIGPGYSWLEALGGIVAEAAYCPLSAWAAARLLGLGRSTVLTRPVVS